MSAIETIKKRFEGKIFLSQEETFKTIAISKKKYYNMLNHSEFEKLPKITFINDSIKYTVDDVIDFLRKHGVN